MRISLSATFNPTGDSRECKSLGWKGKHGLSQAKAKLHWLFAHQQQSFGGVSANFATFLLWLNALIKRPGSARRTLQSVPDTNLSEWVDDVIVNDYRPAHGPGD